MSGIGKRFKDVSYSLPKPLILVNGKPIIEHVIEMFPKEHSFIFICNEEHLDQTDMRKVLVSLVPEAIIVPIKAHNKGPVYATTFAFPYIKDDEDVLLSYCDYAMEFDLDNMLTVVKENGYAGAVPAYTGFHPHLLHNNVYGGILTDKNGIMLEYKEKHSFTEDKMKSYHSAGMYYFSNGKEFKQYTDELSNSEITINGEKYTSMLFYLYLRDGKKIYVPEVKKFMQWGTPEDLEEYESWLRYFAKEKNIATGETSIPQEREFKVRIPYEEGTDNYELSRAYWGEHFIKHI